MPVLSRFLAVGLIIVLSACGSQPIGSGAPQPAQTAAPTQAPEPTAAPTQVSEPTAAPTQVSEPAAAPTQAPEPTQASKPPAGTTPQLNSAVLLVFQRSGGIAGIDETLTVYTDGRLDFSDRKGAKSAQVAPEDLAALQQLLASPEFAALDTRYQAAVADAFLYNITLPGNPRPFSVQTMDGAQHPPVLDQVLVELNKLREQVK
jgi:hypothetical protein